MGGNGQKGRLIHLGVYISRVYKEHGYLGGICIRGGVGAWMVSIRVSRERRALTALSIMNN
jgi:hypothetical protein